MKQARHIAVALFGWAPRLIALSVTLIVAAPASAQTKQTDMFCYNESYHIYTKVFQADLELPSAYGDIEDAWRKEQDSQYPGAHLIEGCFAASNPGGAESARVRRMTRDSKVVDWSPPSSNPQSIIHSLTLDFEPGDGSGFLHARRGYKSASIKLNYRFLLCANEIQVAYALDRKSLEHSQEYVDKFVGTNPNFITPPGEPPVPTTVPLALRVYLKKPGSPYVATLRDGTAGEALGMGCFTGQTSKLGLVAKLIGPKATRPEIKSYLDLLDLSGMTTAAEIDSPLLNPAVPTPAAPVTRAAIRRKPK